MKTRHLICTMVLYLSASTACGGLVYAAAAEDEKPVRTVVQAFENAWNRHDMDAFAALFVEDADFVNVVGIRWIGRTAIKEAHQATHATMFKRSRLRIGDTSVRFLKPDVAVARSVWYLEGHTSPAGEPQPARTGILTNVLVRSLGSWRIAVTQNTDMVPPKP